MIVDKEHNSALVVVASMLGILTVAFLAGLLLLQKAENPNAGLKSLVSSPLPGSVDAGGDRTISWYQDTAPVVDEDFVVSYQDTAENDPFPLEPVVRKQKPSPKSAPTPSPPKKPFSQAIREIGYWVQVFSSVNAVQAETIRDKMNVRGMPTVVTVNKIDGTNWYRVRIGAFESKEEAEHHAEILRRMDGFESSYVVLSPVTRHVPN